MGGSSVTPHLEPDGVEQRAEVLLKAFQPDACLLGTTARDSPERMFRLAAHFYGIRTVAIVDERYGP